MEKDLVEIPESEVFSQLVDLEKNLQVLPSSDDAVLAVLVRAQQILSSIGQQPSFAMRDVLLSTKRGLYTRRLLTHENIEIKVSTLCCIHELSRIVAPDAVCCDNCMKVIFHHTIVDVFGKLSSISGHCFEKALKILETVAKFKSSLILLDLNCRALITQMFQLFFHTIEPNHPEARVSNMEKIMTSLIQESDDDEISQDVLKPLVEAFRMENPDITRRLAENVLRNCSERVKPYLTEELEQMSKNVDAFTNLLASIVPELPAEENVINVSGHEQILQIDGGENAQPDNLLPEVENPNKTLAYQKQTDQVQNVYIEAFHDNTLDIVERLGTKMESGGVLQRAQGTSFESVTEWFDKQLNDAKEFVEFDPLTILGPESNYLPRPSDTKKHHEDLIGSRILVWWPDEDMYYEGVVQSYDPDKDEHKVVYIDGDIEILTLVKEAWLEVKV